MADPSSHPESASKADSLEIIDAICDDFEAAWRTRPQMEDYLDRAPGDVRDDLFPELLRCEVELLQQEGRRPRQQSYLDRFPAYAEAIRAYLGNLQTHLDTAPDRSDTNPSPGRQSLLAGELPCRFGDYELLRHIGSGGMGVVYEAIHVPANRSVALKVIRPDCLAAADNDDRQLALQRFVTEFQAAANLSHDHIVTVYDVGHVEDLPYYTMQFVDGESLHAQLAAGPLEPRRAARYIEQVASAVAHAHAEHILHRDLKPHNILVDRQNDRAMLADFGLAKLASADQELTRMERLGTPAYMAPEQTRDASGVQGAADVYGLGATLFHLLTGRPPFQAATIDETIRLICDVEPVPPRRLNPEIPRDLETVCLKCLHKEPARRYASAGDLAEDLRRWREREPIRARRVGWPEKILLWSRRRPLVSGLLAAVLLLALSAGIALAMQRRASEQRQAEILIDDLEAAPADAVPFAIQSLVPLKSRAVSILERRFEPDVASTEQLHLALALASFGRFEQEYLISALDWAGRDECPNIARAIAVSGAAPTDALQQWSASPHKPATRARAAIVLLMLGDSSAARDVLAPAPDPTARTYFTHWCADLGVESDVLMDQFEHSNDPAIRTGMLLALGEYPPKRIASADVARFSNSLAGIYRQERDPYMLGVIEWLLRKWEKLELVAGADNRPPPERDPRDDAAQRGAAGWYSTSQKQRMIVLDAGEFSMGSGLDDPQRDKDEVPVQMRIDRKFAISAREVSRDQYRRFIDDWDDLKFRDRGPIDKWANRGDARPVAGLTWFDAAAYCNWLSQQEGIPKEQWCYVPKKVELIFPLRNRGYQSGMQAAKDYLSRTGYRLPTEAEWEFACRAGTSTPRFFGRDASLLPEYANFNSKDPFPRPCGELRPNAFGLFDTYGNVLEWCHDKAIKYEDWKADEAHDDNSPGALIMAGEARVLRGGGFGTPPWSLRSANRNWVRPEVRGMDIGFRVARTVPPEE